MLILLLLTLMGISATNTSNIELRISGNVKWHNMAFYAADGGCQAGIELVEQNIFALGFADDGTGNFTVGNISGSPLNFYMNSAPTVLMPSDTSRDAFMPFNYAGTQPHTNLKIGGNPSLSQGSAIQMAAGYEGIGKGAAGGGSFIAYDIVSQRKDLGNSESAIRVQWKHIY